MIEQRFGTVTGVAPLRVRMDGDSEPLPVDVIALVSPAVGDRVSVRVEGTMRIVDGILGGGDAIRAADIETFDAPTWQNLGASSASRVIAQIDIPARPYDRVFRLDAAVSYTTQNIASGSALSFLAASFGVGNVGNAQQITAMPRNQYTNFWDAAHVCIPAYVIPAGVASTARLWHYNRDGTAITWTYAPTWQERSMVVTARPA